MAKSVGSEISIAAFISHLYSLDVRLSAEGERLRVNGPKGTLSAALCEQIAGHKAKILQFLRNPDTTSHFAPPPISGAPKDEALPLSFAQERLWFLEQFEPGGFAYNICRAARLTGLLKIEALEQSLSEIVRRHEVLRTKFQVVDGRPVQVRAPAQKLSISLVELSQLSQTERDGEVAHLIREEGRRTFDLSMGALLRAVLLRLRNDDHILILTTHHVASDAWSMGILTRELWTLYEAYADDKPSPLQDLPVQYTDYAVWQRGWLQGEVLESQLSYWKKQLADIPIVNLPTDRPRPALQSFRGARRLITLPESLTAAVNELSRREGVTQFMTLLAAFNVLLHRYTNQDDILIGSPIANRNRIEIESLIGFFVNTLVLRTDLSGSPTFKEFLLRVRDVCLGAYARQDLPFEKLVAEFQPERDLGRNPLFQVMFLLQNAPRHVPTLSRLTVNRVNVDATVSKFDLTLGLAERDGKLIGFFEYSTDLFDRSTIERMAGHFQTLLEGIVADPDQPISTLPLLTEAERHQLLVEWNDTAADFPRDSCIHELFEAQVERAPDAIAVEFEGEQLTYRELNARANQLAHYLRGLGVKPDKLVGICVERSLDMVVGLLGILKAGGAYVPLDPDYPADRLDFMLRDTQAEILLTVQDVMERLTLNHCVVVYLDSQLTNSALSAQTNPICNTSSRNLAYVMYTSGSTGKPKGVMIAHRAVCNHIHWSQTVFPLDCADSVVQKTSLSFDASVWELFAPLLAGARLVVARPGGHQDSGYLVQLMREQKITVLKLVPSLLQMILKEDIETCAHLRHVLCGGEALSIGLQKEFARRSTAKLHNLYGPTEATIDATFWTCEPGCCQRSAPIGRPINNTQAYVLDPALRPVPIGVAGELHIGGDGIARGYLNCPELSEEKFIPNPFFRGRVAGFYKTGDIVRYLPDGNIEFVGRADNQVKIRGYRVELGEIEVVLSQHPAVRRVVVVAQDDVTQERGGSDNLKSRIQNPKFDQRLVAYIVPAEQKPTVTELRSWLKKKLPDYMIPSAFVMLDALPLTPNGKVDRQKLPPLDDARPELPREFVAPRTEIEELVALVWREVLTLEKIGVHDNFFELGGHSLLATQIVSRLRDAFNRAIPLRVLFEAPTCAALSVRIENLIRERNGPDQPSIVPVGRDISLPLSVNQEQVWHLEQALPGTYNVPYVYRLRGSLNVDALERAFREIIMRHEALRTVFGEVDGYLVQVIKPSLQFYLPVVDLRTSAQDQRKDNAADLVLAERRMPFDLTAGPLLRGKLIRLTAKDWLLLLTIHHIISDQWSMRVLRSELAALYEAFSEGRLSPLAEPGIQFADFTCWERRLLDGGLLRTQLDYWKKQLALPLSHLQFGRNDKQEKVLDFRTARQPIEFNDGLLAGIRALARQENCTPFMVVICALNVTLYLYTSQQDVRIGTLVANRGRRETENSIGHFLNTVILRTTVSPDMTLKEILREVRRVTLAAHANQELPFEQLARVLEREKNIDRGSLFQVLCNYQNVGSESLAMPGLTIAYWDGRHAGLNSDLMITALDLIFNFRESSTKLTGTVNYKTNIFDGAVTDMIDLLYLILKNMIFRPYCQVSAIRPDAPV